MTSADVAQITSQIATPMLSTIALDLPDWGLLPRYIYTQHLDGRTVDPADSKLDPDRLIPRHDGERHDKILSNQAGSEFHKVSTYPASSAFCPLTLDQKVSALTRIDKGPAHHGSRPAQPLSQPSGTLT